MDDCPLCTAGHDDHDDGVTIVPIFDVSGYRHVTDPGVFERLRRLQDEPADWRGTEPPFWDITIWPPVSVTVLWAGMLGLAADARLAGDDLEAQRHEADAAAVWDSIMAGNQAGLEHLQDTAGYADSGPGHWAGLDPLGPGQREEVREWVVGTFRRHACQRTAPQLHVHNLLVNKMQVSSERRIRPLDSKTLDSLFFTPPPASTPPLGPAAAEQPISLREELSKMGWDQ